MLKVTHSLASLWPRIRLKAAPPLLVTVFLRRLSVTQFLTKTIQPSGGLLLTPGKCSKQTFYNNLSMEFLTKKHVGKNLNSHATGVPSNIVFPSYTPFGFVLNKYFEMKPYVTHCRTFWMICTSNTSRIMILILRKPLEVFLGKKIFGSKWWTRIKFDILLTWHNLGSENGINALWSMSVLLGILKVTQYLKKRNVTLHRFIF